jgi:hypothetical protein
VKAKILLLVTSFLFMVGMFLLQEKQAFLRPPSLNKYLPANIQKATLGYFSELGAYFQFIDMTIFLGSYFPGDTTPYSYGDEMAHNFDVITKLQPKVKDFYYLCQSSIAHISPEFSKIASNILQRGAKYFPDDYFLTFFSGFNYYYYCNDKKTAAKILLKSVQNNKTAPNWIGHLAGVLSADEGDLLTGLATLEIMKNISTDDAEKIRYENDINIFKAAINVQNAATAFLQKYGHYPLALDELVPEFISQLPNTGGLFKLRWKGNKIYLKRPTEEEKEKDSQKPLIFL